MKYVTVPAVMMVCLDQVNCLAMALDHASDDTRQVRQEEIMIIEQKEIVEYLFIFKSKMVCLADSSTCRLFDSNQPRLGSCEGFGGTFP